MKKAKYPKVKKNGSVYYRARVSNPTVRSGYSDVYAKTVRELEQKKAEKEKQIKAGVINSNMKFGDYLNQIFEGKIIGGLKESTAKQYVKPMRIIRESAIVNRRLTDLNPPLINSWLCSLDASTGTYTVLSVILRKTFKQAYKDGLITRDLSETVETPKANQKAKNKRAGRLLSNSEISELMIRLNEFDRLLSAFLLDTGLRINEAIVLDWTDVDFDNATVSVTKTMNQAGKITTPKTKSSVRTVPVSPEMLTELKKARLSRRERALSDRYYTFDQDAVFIEESGKRMAYHNYAYHLKQSGLDINPHDFRHTNASRLNESGVSPLVIAKWLGHSKIDTTVNVYTDVTENLERDSLKILNGAKFGAN